MLLSSLKDEERIALRHELVTTGRMDYPGKEVRLYLDSMVEKGTRLQSCKKEPETVAWIESFFTDGDIFYDIGANIGAYSLVAAAFSECKVRTYAFEPGFHNYYQLQKNIALNNFQDCIVALQIALSDRTELNVFNLSSLESGTASHALGEAIDFQGRPFDPVFKQHVAGYRLDDLIHEFRLEPPAHIKVDVDGLELKVLEGARECLTQNVRTLLIELDEISGEAAEVIGLLASCGLTVHSKYKYEFGRDKSAYVGMFNYIFVRK